MYAKWGVTGLAAVMAAGLWVQGASAADVTMMPETYVAPPIPEDVFKWTGLHIGIDAGGQFDFVDSYAYANNYNPPHDAWQYAESWGDLGAQSWFISGDIGADYQAGNFVIGVFANYDFHPNDSSASHQTSAPEDCAFDLGCTGGSGFALDDIEAITTRSRDVGNTVTYGDAWGVGLRAGVLVNPKALVYVLGGYGQKQIWADSNFYFDYYNNLEYTGGLSGGGWQPGWFAGGGVEAAVGKHATLALEYRLAHYDGFSASCEAPDCASHEENGNGSYGTQLPDPYEFNEHGFSIGTTMSHTVRARVSLWLN